MKIFISTPFLLWTHWVHENGYGLSKLLGLQGITEILLTVLLFDFLDAVKHLWFHRVPLMWRFHRVHHTDRHLDILTALRYHPGEMAISALIKAGWILLWGPSVVAFLVFEILLNINSEFHHSNISLGSWDKILNKIFVTPRYHAIHHTIHRERGDQNFSTILSFWDRLLGTYVNPQKTPVNLERLGSLQENHLNLWNILKSPLIEPVPSQGYTGENFQTQREILQQMFNEVKSSQKTSQAVIIDVREPNEILQTGQIKGSISKPFSEFKKDPKKYIYSIDKNYKNKDVFVYCAVGIRSGKVCEGFQQSNLKATNLGGLSDCLENGLTPGEI